MRQKIFILSLLTMICCSFIYADYPKHEFRATWFTTVGSLDWPKTSGANQQKNELIDILDKMKAGNMNAVLFQVRGRSDAFYQSSYEPWASELTNTLGKDPGYDPLAFAIEEAHKRGMELHVWVNPFRLATHESNRKTEASILRYYTAPAGKESLQWEWVTTYTKSATDNTLRNQIIDPGFPAARKYLINVLMEIINNYDVDGIVMDDYFYAYGGTTNEDAAAQALYYNANEVVDFNNDGQKIDDWRRSNVDSVIKNLYDTIQVTKPWVRLGMGTGGVWSTQNSAYNAYGLSKPTTINNASDPYRTLYCNPVEWIKNGWVDYVNPQIYWSTSATTANYTKLCEWWDYVCEKFSDELPNNKRVHFFVSQPAYKATAKETGFESGVGEMKNQINVNRANLSSGSTGSVFFRTMHYLEMYEDLTASHFTQMSLVPPMTWKSTTALAAPENLQLNGTDLSWESADAERFTVYVYPKGLSFNAAKTTSEYLKKVVYGKSTSLNGYDLVNKTIAVCSYDRYGVEHAAVTNAASNTTTQYALTLNTTTGGTITKTPDLAAYDENAIVTITATPDTGYEFVQWSDGNTENPRTIEVIEDMTYTATFAPIKDIEYIVTACIDTTGLMDLVPTQGELWESFSDSDYPLAYINSINTIAGYFTAASLTAVFAKEEWVWLRDYIMAAQNAQKGNAVGTRTVPELTTNITTGSGDVDSAPWRYALGAFFLQSQYTTGWPATADFSLAGQRKAWGGAYLTNIVGSITGSGTYKKGDTAIITATPKYGYLFVQWSDGNTDNPRTVEVTADATYTAEFAVNASNVTVGGEKAGTVPTQDQLWESFSNSDYPLSYINSINTIASYFTAASLTAVFAKEEWVWLRDYIMAAQNAQKGNAVGTRTVPELTTSITKGSGDADGAPWRYALGAFFLQSQYTTGWPATADFTEAGKPEAWGSAYAEAQGWVGIVTGNGTYNNGTTATLTAAAVCGYHFAQWSDGNTDNPRTLMVTKDTTLTAEFALNTYDVTLSVEGQGTVIGGGRYNHGELIQIIAKPAEDYHFVQWSDGNADAERTITVTEDITLTAEFVHDTATELDNVQNGNTTIQKVYQDGTLFIIRGGKKYNAYGLLIE